MPIRMKYYEDGGTIFILNVGTFFQYYRALEPQKTKLLK
jgi:hypothetical protein